MIDARTYNEIVHEVNSEILTEHVKIQKLNTMFDMVLMKEYNLCNEAEYKVYSEGGTYADYEYLCTEAGEAVKSDKKGILSRIWGTITGIIEKIFDGIKGIFGIDKKADTAEVQVDAKYADKGFIDIIQKGLDNIPTPIKNGTALAAATATLVAVGIELKAYSDKFIAKKEVQPITIKAAKGIVDKIGGLVNSIKDMIGNLRKAEEDPSVDTKETEVSADENKETPEEKNIMAVNNITSIDDKRLESMLTTTKVLLTQAKNKQVKAFRMRDKKTAGVFANKAKKYQQRYDELKKEYDARKEKKEFRTPAGLNKRMDTQIKAKQKSIDEAKKELETAKGGRAKTLKDNIAKWEKEIENLKKIAYPTDGEGNVIESAMYVEAGNVRDSAKEFLSKTKDVVVRAAAAACHKILEFLNAAVNMYLRLCTKVGETVIAGAAKVGEVIGNTMNKASKIKNGDADAGKDVTEGSIWGIELE